ncbi:TonB-dependent receptor [Sphingobacterium litopenaei]|uniref:TonB-dependent receptor n=1 Tax=Sphingobacterium litopenaei TaxID=2763500 RepID=UPI001680B025|nr:TonB-dependent receptor [Sphingobacterium litopenaei]
MKTKIYMKVVVMVLIGLFHFGETFANVLDTAMHSQVKQDLNASINKNELGIKGRVLDLESMQPIAGATILVLENGMRTSTNDKGEFILQISKIGEYTLETSYIGYAKEAVHVVLDNDSWANVNVALINESSKLDEVVVTRRRAQLSEISLLEERKVSNLMVEKIGAQELSRKGVSDAEGALTKMSGVTKSASGANVFVRGLGDRYNNTTLNGLALPSEDPLNKNISLDFFDTGIIQSIGVNKTFNASITADVAGANIDIISKELTEDAFLEVGASAGINTEAIRANNFRRIDGTNWLGTLKETKSPITSLTSYDFHNKWNSKEMENPINSSFSIMGGKKFMIGQNCLNVLLTAGMNSDYKYYDGVIRQTNTAGVITLDQSSNRSIYNISKTGMTNLKYTFGNNHLAFNSLYINDQGQEYERNFGFKAFDIADNAYFRRSHVVDNHLFVNQLLSKLEVTELIELDLGLGYNVVKSNEPDRRTLELIDIGQTGTYRLYDTQNFNERYYSDIKETGWSAKAIASYKIENDKNLDRKIEIGYNGNIVDRDFNAMIFGHKKNGSLVLNTEDEEDIDGIYGYDAFQNGNFEFSTGRGSDDFRPYWYSGKKRVHSGLVSGTYQFTEKFTSVLGVRFDNVFQDIVYSTNLSSTELDGLSQIKKNYILPSLNLKYALSENSNLRASASMSYTLPQFLETAYFRNTFSTYSTIGNKDLVPVENTNFDLKWEMFPSSGELISVGAFYKNLKNPIARSETGNNVMTYFNVGSSATVAGVEVELKKNLFKTTNEHGVNVLAAGANVSYLYTKQDLENPNAVFTKFNGTSALQGASPWLVNADVNYVFNGKEFVWTSSIVLNYFSDRIFAIGTQGFKDVIEKSVSTLDFISNVAINKKWGVNVKARNIINPSFELIRDTDAGQGITLQSFRRGVDLSAGVSYKF